MQKANRGVRRAVRPVAAIGNMESDANSYLAKARESLATAESEFSSERYNRCANRCYYACLQAAIGALLLTASNLSVSGDIGSFRPNLPGSLSTDVSGTPRCFETR